MSNLRKALTSAGIGLGIGAGIGALGTYSGIESEENNLNDKIDNFGKNISQVRAELPNTSVAPNSITISGYNKNETPKELIDSIKLSAAVQNGETIDLKKELFDYIHNKEMLQGIENHKGDLLKIGAGLGGVVGSGIGVGIGGVTELSKAKNTSRELRKPITEASLIGKFPKQASTFNITNRLKTHALKSKDLKDN